MLIPVVLVVVVPDRVLPAGVTTVVTAPVVGVLGVPPGVSDARGGVVAGGVGGCTGGVTGVNDACGGGVVGGVGGCTGGVGIVAPRPGGKPSGSTQFTSLLEQKSGMEVRSVDRSAAPAKPAANTASAPTRVPESLGDRFI
jgi:hypothetical protein